MMVVGRTLGANTVQEVYYGLRVSGYGLRVSANGLRMSGPALGYGLFGLKTRRLKTDGRRR